MSEIDFNIPANVLWHAQVPPAGQLEGGETRHFDRLAAAIRFVRDEIPDDQRYSAWITTDAGSLTIEEIERLYDQLPDGY